MTNLVEHRSSYIPAEDPFLDAPDPMPATVVASRRRHAARRESYRKPSRGAHTAGRRVTRNNLPHVLFFASWFLMAAALVTFFIGAAVAR